MKKRLFNKAKLMSHWIDGERIVDLGSEDGTGDNELHKCLEGLTGRNIVSVDFLGEPDVVADLNEELPFHDEEVQTIIASELIEHLENPLYFLKECNRILDKQGLLLLTTPNALGLSEYQTLFYGQSKMDYDEHLYNWNRKNMTFLLKKAGFKVSHFEYISCFWKRNYLFRFLAYIIPVWRSTLFFVAKKE